MARPKPQVLCQFIDSKTYRAEQVLRSYAIFAVFFEGQPINLRSLHTIADDTVKYKKTSFSNAGHAFNLAEKLNRIFKCDKFAVFMLVSGKQICEEETPA